MTGAAEDGGDGAARSVPSNEPLAGTESGGGATHDAVPPAASPTTTNSKSSIPSATALRGRANVYEKYLNQKLQVGEGPTAFGKRLMAAANVVEISNSNDDVELEAGEVVSAVACAVDVKVDADGAGARGSENQENEPPQATVNHHPRSSHPLVVVEVEKGEFAADTGTDTAVVRVPPLTPLQAKAEAPRSPSSPLSPASNVVGRLAAAVEIGTRDEALTATASCPPQTGDAPPPSVKSTAPIEPDHEPPPTAPAASPVKTVPTPIVTRTDAIDSTRVIAIPDAPTAVIARDVMTIDATTASAGNSSTAMDTASSSLPSPVKPRSPIRIDTQQYTRLRREGQLRRDVLPTENHRINDKHLERQNRRSPPRGGFNDRRDDRGGVGGPSPFRGDDREGPGGGGHRPGPGSPPRRGRSRSRSPGRNRDGPRWNGSPNGSLSGPGNHDFRNGRLPSLRENGGFRGGPSHGGPSPFDGRDCSPPRNNHFGPSNRDLRGRSPPRDFRNRPGSGLGSPRGGPGPDGGGGPPFERDGPGRMMNRGPNNGRRSRSRSRSRTRSPQRGPRGSGGPGGPGRSPPRNGPPPGGPDRNFRRSPPRYGGGRLSPRFGPQGGDGPPGGRPGSPRRNNIMGPPRSPHRNGPPPGHMMGRAGSPRGRPGSPGRFGPGGPPRSPPRDGFRGPPPNQMRPRSPGFRGGGHSPNQMRPGSPGFRGGGGLPNQFEPRRESFGRFDYRGPPPQGPNDFNSSGPSPSRPFPPRGRSRSRSPPHKRARSWERHGPPPPPMDGFMQHHNHHNMPQSFAGQDGGLSPWIFEVKRSGRTKFRCLANAVSLPFTSQLPLSLDIVQLPHMNKYQEFLMLDRQTRRSVYEMRPEGMGDKSGYEELKRYLLHGREGGPRAGLALDLERVGYKIFVLPPGIAARALGYKGDLMVAVIRRRN